jgi:hypothetical protein
MFICLQDFHSHHTISNKMALKHKQCNRSYEADSACFAIVESLLSKFMCSSVCKNWYKNKDKTLTENIY